MLSNESSQHDILIYRTEMSSQTKCFFLYHEESSIQLGLFDVMHNDDLNQEVV